jgi:hypothetical protein
MTSKIDLENAFVQAQWDMRIGIALIDGPLHRNKITEGKHHKEAKLDILVYLGYITEDGDGLCHLNVDLNKLAKEKLELTLKRLDQKRERIMEMIRCL